MTTAWDVAAGVRDPEMPVLTLADLGVLRSVEEHGTPGAPGAWVDVAITPTYSGCPAMASMRDDLVHRLRDAGWDDVRVRVELTPAWSSDWITEGGRAALSGAGLSAPGPAPAAARGGPGGAIALTLQPVRRAIACPRCGDRDVAPTSEFGPTACTALYTCRACLEPFQHVKEI